MRNELSSNDVPPAGAKATRQLAVALVAAWNAHDLDQALACFAADCEARDVAQAFLQRGCADMRRAMAGYCRALPDVQFVLDDLVVAGDRAVVVWTATGTHLGMLFNIPASGRRVRVRGAATFIVRDGLICRATYIWDVAGLLRSIGLLPEL